MKNYFLFISIMLFLLISLNACKKEGINLNFQKKEKLKSNAKMIFSANWNTSQEYLSVFDLSKQNKIYNLFEIQSHSRYTHPSFVIKPDKKSVFINNGNTIYQINSNDGNIIGKISIAEAFPNKRHEYKFDKLLAVSDSKLWFLISIPKDQIRSNRIYYWKYKNKDLVCKKTEFTFSTGNIITTSKDKFVTAWFYLKNNEPKKIPTNLLKGGLLDFDFVDYSKEKGWILSAPYPDPDYNNIEFITYINPNNKVIKLCKGGLAVFGNDDFIYFVREQATIWRISLKTKKEELVFTPSKLFFPKNNDWIHFFSPLFNQDKTLMMFPYEQKGKMQRDWPFAVIIIFDFINQEYRILDRQLNQTRRLFVQEPKWLKETEKKILSSYGVRAPKMSSDAN